MSPPSGRRRAACLQVCARRALEGGSARSCTSVAALVDTNVLVYRFDSRFPAKQKRATALLRAGIAEDSIRVPHGKSATDCRSRARRRRTSSMRCRGWRTFTERQPSSQTALVTGASRGNGRDGTSVGFSRCLRARARSQRVQVAFAISRVPYNLARRSESR
jgi:hypothetical protein